jgi:hypothetical protein
MVVSIIATSFRRGGITRTSDSPYARPPDADDPTVETAAVIDRLVSEGWEHRHLGADDLIAGGAGVFLLATKGVPGRVAIEDGALTARLDDDDETVIRYGGLRGRLLGAAGRLGRGVRAVVVIWGDFPGGVVEDDGVAYVHGDELTGWLGSQQRELRLAS